MKIVINLLRFNKSENIGGNYTFSYNILKNLIEKSNHEFYLLVNKDSKELFDFTNTNVKYMLSVRRKGNLFFQILDENLFIMRKLKEIKVDLFYSPNFLLPFVPLDIPTVSTIHDINFRHFSQGFIKDLYKNINYKHTLKKSTLITTVSRFTKLDVCEKIGDYSNKIEVVYNGCNFKIEDLNKIFSFKEKYNINGNYILATSHYKHKNAELAIKAFAYTKGKIADNYSLVITGAKGQLKKELINLTEKLHISNRVYFIDFIDQKYIEYMYLEASLYLFPSKFEGFGLPVIEAMRMQCPVISSSAASLPEVVGNGGVILDNFNVDDWGNQIINIINDEKIKMHYIDVGLKQSQKFSWESSSQQLLNIFDEAYKRYKN